MAKPKRGRSTATIDDHIGGRIRERRIMLGLTQQLLAEKIGVTYQQAHKYKPLYTWVKDQKPGDTSGNGINKNTWHVAQP